VDPNAQSHGLLRLGQVQALDGTLDVDRTVDAAAGRQEGRHHAVARAFDLLAAVACEFFACECLASSHALAGESVTDRQRQRR
jgi:hypothetical protein